MAAVTLKTILQEMKKRDAKEDTRFEFLKEQIQLTRTELKEVKTDVAALKTDVAVLKTDVAVLKTDVAVLKTDVAGLKSDVNFLKEEFTKVHRSLKIIRDQTAHVTERVAWLEHTSKQ